MPLRGLLRIQSAWLLARALLWAAWIVLLGLLVLNWHHLALRPVTMNPVQGTRLAAVWLIIVAVAALILARRLPQRIPLVALALAGSLSLPPDLWALGSVGGVALGLLASRPAIAWPAFAMQCVAALWGGYERIFGPLSAESSSTLAQTAPAEVMHFLLHLLTPGWLTNQVAYAATLVFAVRAAGSTYSKPSAADASWPLLTMLSALCLLAASPGLLQRGMALRQGLQQHEVHVQTVENAAPPAPRVSSVAALDVVWVIGESQSRTFWQLYGYPRGTTPQLQALQEDLVVMTDAVSPHSYTVQSLMQAAYRGRADGDGDQVSLLALLQSAGVAVRWHSAQEQFGPWASPVVRWASGADELQRHGSHLRLGLKGAGAHPDRLAQAALLHDLAAGAGGRQLLVHHMYAAHDPYCAHAQETTMPSWREELLPHAWFGGAKSQMETLRCYEGAVRFTDQVLAGYVQALRGRTRPGVLVFVPDHGEDPAGGTGHNADRPSLWHIEIPVVLYANDAARSALGPAWTQLAANSKQPFLGSWVYELMLDLMGIAAPELNLKTPSRTAPGFRAPSRVIYPQGRRWDYDGNEPGIDVLSSARSALARTPTAGRVRPAIYAHRVNSVLKALQAYRDFDGIEFDVLLDPATRQLLVNHPPMPVSGLTVDELLAATAQRPGLRVWLDFKNPAHSPELAIQLLNAVDSRWKLRRRAVLELPTETPESTKAMYASAGWVTSLYLPDSFAACNDVSGAVADCTRLATGWIAEARRTGLAAFSFDDALRPAVERYIRPLAPEQRYLSWKLSLRADDPQLVESAADLSPLDALIVSFPSAFSP